MRASLEEAASSAARPSASEPRVGYNGLGWSVRTPLGSFDTRDRTTWRRQMATGLVYLAHFHERTTSGRYDPTGWHAASRVSRALPA
jgi:hypothetical protein